MTGSHLEFLIEEPSMEAFLSVLLPRLFPDSTFAFRVFQGKKDMLGKLEARLQGYGHRTMGVSLSWSIATTTIAMRSSSDLKTQRPKPGYALAQVKKPRGK